MKKKHGRRSHVGLCLLILILLGIFPLIHVAPPYLDGTMLISRDKNGMMSIDWLDTVTGDIVTVKDNRMADGPDLSPDGQQIVYTGRPGLYLYTRADQSIRQITDGERDSKPHWSPDGRAIVFLNSRDFFSALFRYDVATGERHQLTNYQNDLEPDWSPDGERIVFTTSRDGFQELYTMRPDGSDLQRLTHNVGLNDLRAAYSPDGQHIAYMTNYSVGDGSGEIWLMNADGSQQRRLTHNDMDDGNPVWSPDSRYIAFAGTTADSRSDIFVYNLRTDTVQQIVSLPTIDAQPIWSPDGQWIGFTGYSPNGKDRRTYVVRPDGSALQPVTEGNSEYSLILWLPRYGQP